MTLPALPGRSTIRTFDVVGFGENSLDFLAAVSHSPDPGDKRHLKRLEILPGGQIATAVVACARLGWRGRYIGSFGDDQCGAQIEQALARENVNVVAIRRDDVNSRVAVILVDAESGERTVLAHRDARLAIGTDELDLAAVTSGRVLIVDATDLPAATTAARAARAVRIPTVVDIEDATPGAGELLAEIDVLIAAEAFPQAMTGASFVGEALRRLSAEFRPSIVVATLGAQGSLALFEGREIRTPAFPVEVVDTTGAGDAFRGGFVAAWLNSGREVSVETLLMQANRVAALNCRAFGAQTALPTPTEIDQFL